jgi:hypothetical protein
MKHQKFPKMILGLILMLLTLSILACNLSATKSTSTPSTGKLEDGWVLYKNEASGFAIALPPTWDKIDIDPQTINAAIDDLGDTNPELASFLKGQASSLIASGAKFFGFDGAQDTSKTGFATNVNILVQSMGMEVTLDYYMQVNVAQLDSTSYVVKPISEQRVEVAAGEAGELRYKLSLTGQAGQPLTVSTLQYIVVDGKKAYVITFTTTSDQEEDYASVFEKIVKSFQLFK